jgi:3-phenylpropionate/trans-cinnamate dioxygenase ferredoxin subunit
MRHVVATVADIPPGSRLIVEVERRSIGIFNVDGEFFALRNRCPHQGAALCEGKIWGTVESRGPGDLTFSPTPDMVSCPWHGWEFQIRTGQSWCEPERLRIADYPIGVRSGREIAKWDDGTGNARVKGPYAAETFPVSVEENYVVVEIR